MDVVSQKENVREQPHRRFFFFFYSLLMCDLVAPAPTVSEGCPYTFIGTVFFWGFWVGVFRFSGFLFGFFLFGF